MQFATYKGKASIAFQLFQNTVAKRLQMQNQKVNKKLAELSMSPVKTAIFINEKAKF